MSRDSTASSPPAESNRNQLCGCGSGKRYKHCHGAAAVAGAAVTPAKPEVPARDPRRILHDALAQQKDGRLTAAEALYEQALAVLPGHFDALHLLGVVRLQLEKFEPGARLLVAALPMAPSEAARAEVKRHLALCLRGLASQRGVLETLTAAPAGVPPAPFVRAHAIPARGSAAPGRISVIVTELSTLTGLQHSLAGVRAQESADIELVAAINGEAPEREALQAALNQCAVPSRLIAVPGGSTLADQVNQAAAAATGATLCFLRAGDRWAPQWLQRMSAALHAFGGQWACSGLRAVADDATPVRFGSSPEVDALLRAQDALYLHRRASLGFLSYNPIAAGRSLMVESELWQRSAGLPAGVADPFLEWGRHRAWSDEPVYLDEPGCLIPAGSAGLHLHGQLPRMVAWTESRLAGEARDDAADSGLRRGYALFRAHHWRQMCTPQWWPLPDETLLACAATLGIVPGESSPSIPVGSQA